MGGALTATVGILKTASGGGGGNFSSDFTGTNGNPWPSDWTTLNGSMEIQSNTGRFNTGSFTNNSASFTGGTCSTIDQYQKVAFPTFAANSYYKAIFRYTNSSSPFYIIQLDVNAGGIEWHYAATLAAFVAGTVTVIGTSGGFAPFASNDTLAITLEGTGNSTNFRFWKNPTGNTPTGDNNWGGASAPVTMADDPGLTVVDTGGVLGVGCEQSGANQTSIDTWFGGDTP